MVSSKFRIAVLTAAAFPMILSIAWASQTPVALTRAKPIVQSARTAKFGQLPVLPSCQHFAVDRGDPRTGPFQVIIKMKAGCSIPWHWHSAEEEVMIVSGTVKSDIEHLHSRLLHPGGYFLLPARHPHRVTCETACVFFDASPGKFDIHYINGSGKEIPVAQALKAVSEKPGTPQ